MTTTPTNSSFIGRLLEEISWDGARVRGYRDGGRGRENVLTAEVLLPLSYLPRGAFLGEVVRSAHGADAARAEVVDELELADVTLLPDESRIDGSGVVVQPDAVITSPGCHVLVEAKRIRASAFQELQLAREYVTVLQDADGRVPVLLLVLGAPPPVQVKKVGRLDPSEAIRRDLHRVVTDPDLLPQLLDRVEDVVAWTTWGEIAQVVHDAAPDFDDLPDGAAGTVARLARDIVDAIAWHS